MTEGTIDTPGEVEAAPRPRLEAGAWQPPPLELVVCEPLEDEAHRSAAQKDDAELVDMYEIARAAHAAATDGGDGREGEADYWDVLQRAIVAEAARRPSFGQDLPEGDEPRGRRHRRRLRRRVEALVAAREAEIASPAGAEVVDDRAAAAESR